MKKTKVVSRRTVQLFFIFLFVFLLYKTTGFPLPEKLPLSFFFRINGLLALFTSISTLHLSKYFLPAFILMFLVLMRGNFFCYWICPMGGAFDFCNIALFRKKWKLSVKIPPFLRKIKFILLGGFLLTASVAIFIEIPHLLWAADPYVLMARAFIFRGTWLLLFIGIVVSSIIMPRVWCNNICPLGCLNNILGVKIRFFIKKRMFSGKEKG